MRVTGSITISLAVASMASPTIPQKPTWSGWNGVKNLFVFGDSYSQTGFNVNGTQPSSSNPFGNPPYPGWTSSNGPNWSGFLTTTYNNTFVKTFSLAQGGATVDSALVVPYKPTVLSLKDQVNTLFTPTYSQPENNSTASAPRSHWTSSDSLFAFWIGINDVGNSWWLENSTVIYDEIFTVYNTLLEQLHTSGARNFLFLSVPPVNLAPLTLANGDYAVENEGKAIKLWNEKLETTVKAFEKKRPEVSVFVHDTWGLFGDVIKDPATWKQTQELKNVTGFCNAYANGTPTWYTKDPSCEFAVDEYLWLNDLHPTFRIHNATAASLVKFLDGQS